MFLVNRCDFEIPKLLQFLSNTIKSQNNEVPLHSSCNICGDTNCSRDKIVHKHKPWVGLLIPTEIDDAVEKVCFYYFSLYL